METERIITQFIIGGHTVVLQTPVRETDFRVMQTSRTVPTFFDVTWAEEEIRYE